MESTVESKTNQVEWNAGDDCEANGNEMSSDENKLGSSGDGSVKEDRNKFGSG